MRWVASMVADVHRILSRGGVFMYPWDKREPEKAGKLRLLYEANPMSFLVEQAGGMPRPTARQRIMDLQPDQAARARRGVPRLEERSGARDGLPPRDEGLEPGTGGRRARGRRAASCHARRPGRKRRRRAVSAPPKRRCALPCSNTPPPSPRTSSGATARLRLHAPLVEVGHLHRRARPVPARVVRAPQHRRQGLARAAMAGLADIALAQGCSRIEWLAVRAQGRHRRVLRRHRIDRRRYT